MSYEQLAASVDALAEANRSLTEQALETQAGSIAASDNATAKALEAAQAALSAEDSARVATDAANLAKDSTDIMDSTAAGIAAGKPYFYTVSPDSKQVLILWKNTDGVAVDTGKRTPSVNGIPTVSVEGKTNLVDPLFPVIAGFGINAQSEYAALATSKAYIMRVDAGRDVVISNTAGVFSAFSGYGAVFYSGDPSPQTKISAFSTSVLISDNGTKYCKDTVPVNAKYLVFNFEFQSVVLGWNITYGKIFKSPVAYTPRVAKIDDTLTMDRDLTLRIESAFSVTEGTDNLFDPSKLASGFVSSNGTISTANLTWNYIKIPVKAGTTYAMYTGASSWAFPTAASFGVNGAAPVADTSKVTFIDTTDPLVKLVKVPSDGGVTDVYINVYITPPGGTLDYRTTLIFREGTSVPVRPLPFKASLAQIDNTPVKDSGARSAISSLNSALEQRTGKYNLVNPTFSQVTNIGINGQNNYGTLATAKSISIPVVEGMPIVIHNPSGGYRAAAGDGAAFFSTLPTTDNATKVKNFANPLNTTDTITNADGLTYRKDVVPAGAKYLVLNVEFQAVVRNWFVAYDTGFTSAEPYVPAITEISGAVVTDRQTQIIAKETSRLVNRRFAGKKVYYFGDSITEGNGGGFPSYTNRVTQMLNCLGTNYGSSGAKTDRLVGIMTNLDPRDGTAKKATPDYTGVEAITIMIGTNDTGPNGTGLGGSLADIPTKRIQDIPFTTDGGVLVTTPDDYFNLFPNTYYGNLSLCIEYVKWKNPATEIFLISATQRGTTSTPMDKVVEAMQAISKFYSIRYFNATHECGVDLKGLETYTYDMLHPNAIGVERIGRYVGNRLLHA